MNKKMRVFPQGMLDFEKVFTNKRYLKSFNIGKLRKPRGFSSIEEYRNEFKNFLIKKSASFWADMVEVEWMISNFDYSNLEKKGCPTNVAANAAFSVFSKEYIGASYLFLTSSFYYNQMKSYFKEIFPNFYSDNPFSNPEKYKYPYKNITIDYLYLVYQLPERLELLDYAEKRNIPFGTFLDYIINYIGKCNDLEEEETYIFIKPDHYPFYVKNLKNNGKEKRK